MTSSDHKFLDLLMNRIFELHYIPKVQVERVLSPILSLFIADALTKKFENHDILSGKYELVSLEFPIKKDDCAQSTNADFLFVNTERDFIALLEMKTTKNLGNGQQLGKYLKVRERVNNEGGGFFIEDIKEITRRSKQKEKYNSLFKSISAHEDIIVNSKDLKIFYLVPNALNKRLLEESNIDFIFTFSDLPENIGSELDSEWKIIKLALEQLDKTNDKSHSATKGPFNNIDGTCELKSSSEINYKEIEVRIRKQIIKYLGSDYPKVVPLDVRLGKKSKKGFPNYQVKFSNMESIPFYHSGTKFTRSKIFNTNNLHPKVLWDNFGNE